MKKKLFILSIITLSGFAYAQVGVNEPNPSATLDIKSKGNTSATKALEINNSDAKEMVTVLDNGNVGINAPVPTAKLHTNGSIRYENLPVVTGSVKPVAIDANGYVGTFTPNVLYSYITIDNSQATSSFSLYSNSVYYGFPFLSSGILSNSLGASIGTDANATLARTSGVNNAVTGVTYFTLPEAGIYKINLNYYTSCTGTPSGSSGGNNLLGIGSGIYLANSGSTTYAEQSTIRNNAFPLRNANGDLATGRYNYPTPNIAFTIVETTAANQKLAFFVNWGTADQFNTNVCSLSTPTGLDKKVTLIITKL